MLQAHDCKLLCLRHAWGNLGVLRGAATSANSSLLEGLLAALLAVFCGLRRYGSYLVDPASSHMLVSKIKPCMS